MLGETGGHRTALAPVGRWSACFSVRLFPLDPNQEYDHEDRANRRGAASPV